MWYQTRKCSTLCRAGHFIGQVENVWSHTRPFSKEFQPNLFHSQTSIKITFYIFTFFFSEIEAIVHCTDYLWLQPLVLIYLWGNFTDCDEKQDTLSPKKPCLANCQTSQLFVHNCPFCHSSLKEPLREGGNYQSTPILLSTAHQAHRLGEKIPSFGIKVVK